MAVKVPMAAGVIVFVPVGKVAEVPSMVAAVTLPVAIRERVSESPSFTVLGDAVSVQDGAGGGGGGVGPEQSEFTPQISTALVCAKLLKKVWLSGCRCEYRSSCRRHCLCN